MTSHRLLTLMLLLAGAVHAASPQNLGPSGDMAQCEALGLSSCPQPFDAILPPAEDMLSWDLTIAHYLETRLWSRFAMQSDGVWEALIKGQADTGQAIAINPIEKLVMVQWSTWKQAETPPSLYDERALFFNALAHALGHPPTTAATGATADGSRSSEPAPFVREWRAVMSTGEAKLLPYAGSGFKIERRPISAAQLDRLEALLLPMLAAELKSKGSRNPPSSYFRQYAAARSGKHQVILVHGYLRDTGHSIDWTRKPVDANDGAQNFWDAVYVVKRHQFAKLKRDGSAVRHTVIFQRAA